MELLVKIPTRSTTLKNYEKQLEKIKKVPHSLPPNNGSQQKGRQSEGNPVSDSNWV